MRRDDRAVIRLLILPRVQRLVYRYVAVVECWIAGIIRVVDCIGVAATRVVYFLLVVWKKLVAIVGVEGDFSANVYIPRVLRCRWKVRHCVRGIDKAKGPFK